MNKKLVYILTILIAAGALAVFLILPSRNAARQMTDSMGAGQQDTAGTPAEFSRPLGNLPLQGILSGPEASSHISQLHGTNITMDESYMAMYGGDAQQVLLWVSRSKEEKQAEALLRSMDEKMPQSQTFTNYRKETISGREVYRVEGGGMDNFYYLQGRAVFWVGVQGGNSEDMLKQVLNNFKNFK